MSLPKRFNRRISIALGLGLASILGLSGCALLRHGPPVPPERSAAAVELPRVTLPEQAELLAMGTLHDPARVIARIGEWSTALGCPVPAEQVIASIKKETKLDFDAMPAGSNIATYLWKGSGFMGMPTGAVLLPVAPEALGELGAEAFGKGSVIGDAAGIQKARESEEALLEAAAARTVSDVQGQVSLERVMQHYGEPIRAGMQSLKGMIVGLPAGTPAEREQLQRVLDAELAMAQDLLEQGPTVTSGMSLGGDWVEWVGAVKARPGSALASYLNGRSIAAPDLAQFFPATSLMRGQMSTEDAGRKLEAQAYFGTKFMGDSTTATQTWKRYQEQMTAWGTTHVGFAFDMTDHLRYQGVVLAEQPEKVMALMREVLGEYNDGPIAAYYESMGMKMQVESRLATRKLRGAKVDQYEWTLTMDSLGANANNPFLTMLSGTHSLEVARFGQFVMFSIGEPIESLVERVYAGQGTPLRAWADYPVGASGYVDIDAAPFVNKMGEMVVTEGGTWPMAPLQEGLTPLRAVWYTGEEQAMMRVRVPRDLIAAMVAACQKTAQP